MIFPERDRRVIEKVAKRLVVSQRPETLHDTRLSFGEKLADKVASFGGSWTFLILFAAVLAGWVLLNTVMLAKAFDPYP